MHYKCMQILQREREREREREARDKQEKQVIIAQIITEFFKAWLKATFLS